MSEAQVEVAPSIRVENESGVESSLKKSVSFSDNLPLSPPEVGDFQPLTFRNLGVRRKSREMWARTTSTGSFVATNPLALLDKDGNFSGPNVDPELLKVRDEFQRMRLDEQIRSLLTMQEKMDDQEDGDEDDDVEKASIPFNMGGRTLVHSFSNGSINTIQSMSSISSSSYQNYSNSSISSNNSSNNNNNSPSSSSSSSTSSASSSPSSHRISMISSISSTLKNSFVLGRKSNQTIGPSAVKNYKKILAEQRSMPILDTSQSSSSSISLNNNNNNNNNTSGETHEVIVNQTEMIGTNPILRKATVLEAANQAAAKGFRNSNGEKRIEQVERTRMNGKNLIYAGTVAGLVGVFIGVDEVDPTYLHTFLYTYRFFMTPMDFLLRLVFENWNWDQEREIEQAQFETEEQRSMSCSPTSGNTLQEIITRSHSPNYLSSATSLLVRTSSNRSQSFNDHSESSNSIRSSESDFSISSMAEPDTSDGSKSFGKPKKPKRLSDGGSSTSSAALVMALQLEKEREKAENIEREKEREKEKEKEREREIQEWRHFRRLRLVKVLRKWVTLHPEDFQETDETYKTLQKFFEENKGTRESRYLDSVRIALDNCNKPRGISRSSSSVTMESKPSTRERAKLNELSFWDFKPEIMAEQLTLIESELFAEIKDNEFYDQILNSDNVAGENLLKMAHWAEKLHLWVATEICIATNSKQRVSVLKRFILMARFCQEMNNFNAVFEIVRGLSLEPVQRLAKTWIALPSKLKIMWQELYKNTTTRNDYEVYRQLLSEAVLNRLPFIPCLTILMEDLVKVTEGTSTYLDSEQKRINWIKFHNLGEILMNIRTSRETKYNFKVLEKENRWLQTSTVVMDNLNDLMRLSDRCEPQNS